MAEDATPSPEEKPRRIHPLILILGVAIFLFIDYILLRVYTRFSRPLFPNSPIAIEGEPTSTPLPTTPAGEIVVPETIVIEMKAGSYYYTPNVINLKKGDRVKIIMTSMDSTHDFNLDELGLGIPPTSAGNSNEVEFVLNNIGTYEYYCGMGNHREMGQVGTMVITE